jgi:hypothetical protein
MIERGRLLRWCGWSLAVGLGVAACAPVGPDDPPTDDSEHDVDALRPQMCGGIAGLPCADGYTCVDDPSDGCDPDVGADCSGVCKRNKHPSKKQCKDPSRVYVSTDPAECSLIKYYCASGEGFSDECGCGCVEPVGTPCGDTSCGAGEYCCNDSCGICAPIGAVCIQIACAPACAPEDCGPPLGMPNTLCADGETVAGPTGSCIPTADGCGWEVVSCP